MGPARQQSELETLRERLGAEWPNIAKARAAADEKRTEVQDALKDLSFGADTSLVVFGSLARGEVTSGSDIDWTLLVDGATDPQHLKTAFTIGERLRELAKEPGPEATFGGLASSHDLIHKIGGSDDTNKNTTQRILLLLESAVIGPDEAYNRVISNVLRRYVLEDTGWMHAEEPWKNVPRFLQNDIARYWRTMAVDFAYKRRQRQEKGWALRNAKLRMSRKPMYAAGLLMCFSLEMENITGYVQERILEDEREAAMMFPVVDHLFGLSRKTPLEIIARVILQYEGLERIAHDLFGSYDLFLAMIDDREARTRLDRMTAAEAKDDPLYRKVKNLGEQFQGALTQMFLEENGTPLLGLTKKYGVF